MTLNPPAGRAPIDALERARRAEAVQAARGSVRLEGFMLPPACAELDRRFIAGELSSAEHTAECLRLAGLGQ